MVGRCGLWIHRLWYVICKFDICKENMPYACVSYKTGAFSCPWSGVYVCMWKERKKEKKEDHKHKRVKYGPGLLLIGFSKANEYKTACMHTVLMLSSLNNLPCSSHACMHSRNLVCTRRHNGNILIGALTCLHTCITMH